MEREAKEEIVPVGDKLPRQLKTLRVVASLEERHVILSTKMRIIRALEHFTLSL